MRLLPFLLSSIVTAALVVGLNMQLPLGSIKSPRLGYFLSPQQGFWQNAEATNQSYSENISIKGLNNKVDVLIDDRLVPHIYAENDLDAYYVQGFLHAKFRLWQMEFQTYVAGGRLSEIIGEERLPLDRYFRRIGMVYGAEKTMERMNQNPTMKATVEAYSNGVNAYIKTLKPEQIPFEYKLLDYKPEQWTPVKTYLFLMLMAYDLTARGATADLKMTNTKNYLGYEAFEKLFPNIQDSLDPIIPRSTVFSKPSINPIIPKDIDSIYLNKSTNSSEVIAPLIPNKNNGSNNWAVAGSKTASGKPILCNDPHLGLNLPSLWYEVQINTPSHNTYGASFPGSPAVIIGFNDSIAWGVTNAGRDVIDYYDIKFRDTTMKEYWYNGAWKKASHRIETIKIKGKPDVEEHIAVTDFGPVMYDRSFKNASTEGKYLAIKWTANTAGNGLQTFYQLNRAKNITDYQQAIDTWSCPGQNFVFASKNGDIAIKQQGAFIARWKHQGDFIMPGTDSSYDWQSIIPSNENPMIVNPAIGFVSSANQMPTDSTYPYYLGASSNFPLYRGIIINRKLAAMNGITAKDMQQMQNDNYNVFAEMARPVLLKYINEKLLNKNELRYITILKKWNLKQDIAEQGATVFNAIWDSLSQEIFQDDFQKAKQPISWPEDATLLQSLLKDSAYSYADNISTRNKVETIQENIHLAVKKAAARLQQLEKIATINWADIKDTRINHVLKLPALSRLHLTIGGGKNCINATTDMHGPSWRMIVHLTDEMEAYGVYPGGQNGNPGSRFYDNFIDSWAAGNYYRLLFLSKPAAEKNEKIKWHITFNHG